jgi:hypothetical protein
LFFCVWKTGGCSGAQENCFCFLGAQKRDVGRLEDTIQIDSSNKTNSVLLFGGNRSGFSKTCGCPLKYIQAKITFIILPEFLKICVNIYTILTISFSG